MSVRRKTVPPGARAAHRALAALVWVGAFAVARPLRAQNPRNQAVAQYVCQTPRFWCAFLWGAGVPDGSLCTCNTPYGPVAGYSLLPIRGPSAVPLPAPQRPPPPATTTRVPSTTAGTPDEDECYNGLGNCSGSYSRAVARTQIEDPDDRRRVSRAGAAPAALAGEWVDDDGTTYTITRQPSGQYRIVMEDEDEGGTAVFEFRVTGTSGTGTVRFPWPAEDRARCVGVTTARATVGIRVLDQGNRLKLTAGTPELNSECRVVYGDAESNILSRR